MRKRLTLESRTERNRPSQLVRYLVLSGTHVSDGLFSPARLSMAALAAFPAISNHYKLVPVLCQAKSAWRTHGETYLFPGLFCRSAIKSCASKISLSMCF